MRSVKGMRPDCLTGLLCMVPQVVHCARASHLRGCLVLHRCGNTRVSESLIVFWQIGSKVSFSNGMVYYDNILTDGKRCLVEEVPFPNLPKALTLARRVKC